MNTVLKAGNALAVALLVGVACTPAGRDTPEARAGAQSAAARAPGSPDAAPTSAARAPDSRPAQGRAWVIFGADTVVAEVARTPDEREQGLMYRQELSDGTGMLFVFDDLEVRSFWMQNTYVALDIAYMDASFAVVDIQQMEPLNTDPHESAGPAMFALEVPKGWFAAHGVGVGARAEVVFGLR